MDLTARNIESKAGRIDKWYNDYCDRIQEILRRLRNKIRCRACKSKVEDCRARNCNLDPYLDSIRI